jgi:DUF971 family protein
MLPEAADEPVGSTTPVDIELDRSARVLRLAWADGRQSAFDWEFLRWRCPCAWCSGEGDRPGALQDRTELRPDETEMTDVELVGRYALQPTWKDGHDTGIYTFRGLRALAEHAQLLG